MPPKRMQSKFEESQCAYCDIPIKKGAWIFYAKEVGAWHAEHREDGRSRDIPIYDPDQRQSPSVASSERPREPPAPAVSPGGSGGSYSTAPGQALSQSSVLRWTKMIVIYDGYREATTIQLEQTFEGDIPVYLRTEEIKRMKEKAQEMAK